MGGNRVIQIVGENVDLDNEEPDYSMNMDESMNE